MKQRVVIISDLYIRICTYMYIPNTSLLAANGLLEKPSQNILLKDGREIDV